MSFNRLKFISKGQEQSFKRSIWLTSQVIEPPRQISESSPLVKQRTYMPQVSVGQYKGLRNQWETLHGREKAILTEKASLLKPFLRGKRNIKATIETHKSEILLGISLQSPVEASYANTAVHSTLNGFIFQLERAFLRSFHWYCKA